ncbi:PASTA domain-containing protein [Danxiaibacter flavus]|uniref:PASTA domain-containing protein n=1 Tax=Danxiaibacter flavus TaxID=3049108 RepID=A0ABV3ZD75_9BACT|nr:PASTA domain-containing protein [Chitinophagaceae bacterium DXS]
MFKFITTKPFWVNILIAIVLALLLFFGFFSSLGWLTHHDANARVPSVVGKTVAEATTALEAQGFDVTVQDSVYIDTLPKQVTVKQSPEADALVKQHRTIYLTINRSIPPLVEMPDLRGFSFKSAQLYLQSLGLKMGEVSYKPDIAKNAVLDQVYNNNPIKPGTKINMGSTIALVIGSGVGSTLIDVPDLTGMTVKDARSFLSAMSIGISTINNADAAVANQENAYIVRQNPEPYNIVGDGQMVSNKIRAGQLIDIWVSDTKPAMDSAGIISQPSNVQ